jgi:hypothetical protein
VHDLGYIAGRMSRIEHLERFGGLEGDKFSAAAEAELGEYLAAHTAPSERVLIFGFSGSSYVRANRAAGSRFFWSYPVISGFKEGEPGYGVAGLLTDLERSRPAFVVLQQRDWDPDGPDSATFFQTEPRLARWLAAGYAPSDPLRNYLIWRRSDAP